MTEQTKILETLTRELDVEQGKIDQLNASVREIKTKITEIRTQMQTIENDIQTKQKSKDDISENVTKRDAMVAYYQKNKKTLNEANVKYEVRDQNKLNRLITKDLMIP